MTIRLDPKAVDDLEQYLSHVERADSAAAGREFERVRAVLEALEERPSLGRHDALRGLRRPVRSFPIPPLRLYYEADDEGIYVLRVYHQARRPISR